MHIKPILVAVFNHLALIAMALHKDECQYQSPSTDDTILLTHTDTVRNFFSVRTEKFEECIGNNLGIIQDYSLVEVVKNNLKELKML